MEKLKRNFEWKSLTDNLVHARHSEELDMISNLNKESRTIMTGITSTNPPPKTVKERKIWFRELAEQELAKVDPEAVAKIKCVKNTGKGKNEFRMAEMKTAEDARAVRKEYARKKKEGLGLGTIFLANSVTLAATIRVSIFHAMARQFATSWRKIFVKAYIARSILLITEKNGSGEQTYGLTFTDTLMKFRKDLNKSGLDEAYMRAGRIFKDRLEQSFVVLFDGKRDLKLVGTSNAYHEQEGEEQGEEEDPGEDG